MFAHLFKFDPDQPRDKIGRWTATGSGGKTLTAGNVQFSKDTKVLQDGTVFTSNVEDAAKALAVGRKVELKRVDEVSTLLDKLASMVKEAETKGEKAPTYDLCKVTVKNTNIFCVESKGIPRVRMPQLKGFPLPGSKAAALPKDERGEVDVSAQFRKHLESKGIKVDDDFVKASHLKASQNELNGAKVAGIANAIRNNKLADERIFVSSDNYVVDGHHRWAATVGVDAEDGDLGGMKMKVARVRMGIIRLLHESNQFAKAWGIPQMSVGDNRRAKKIDSSCGCGG